MLTSIEKPGTPEELVHFGVKGMKWGVRKEIDLAGARRKAREIARSSKSKVGQEVQEGKATLRVAKAERKRTRAARAEADITKTQAKIDEIKAKPAKGWYTQRQRKQTVKDLEEYRDQRKEDLDDIRNDRLTDTQKKVLIGVGITAGILAAYGTYKFVDSGTANQLLRRSPWKVNELLTRKMSPDELFDEVVMPINPEFGARGTKMNCRRCTFAYELRRRGYDVEATRSITATGQTAAGLINATDPEANYKTGPISIGANMMKEGISASRRGGDLSDPSTWGPFSSKIAGPGGGLGKDAIKLAEIEPFDFLKPDFDTNAEIQSRLAIRSKSIFDHLNSYPDGARGEIGVSWHGGGGHSMIWERVNGVAHIFDGQTGQRYDVDSFTERAGMVTRASTTRLDNLELNTNYLRRWVRDASQDSSKYVGRAAEMRDLEDWSTVDALL